MLPGSDCGDDSVCHVDKCVPKSELDSSILTPQYVDDYLDLTKHCKAAGTPNELKASNKDPREEIKCVDWENDFLCEPSATCPDHKDEGYFGLHIRHACCAKCSKKPSIAVAAFSNHARQNSKNTVSIFPLIFLFFFLF